MRKLRTYQSALLITAEVIECLGLVVFTLNLYFLFVKVKLLFQIRQVTYLSVSVALICLVLYLKKILLSKKFIFYCLVVLNSVLFFILVCFDSSYYQMLKLNIKNFKTSGVHIEKNYIINSVCLHIIQ